MPVHGSIVKAVTITNQKVNSMYPRNLKPVTDTIVPNYVQWHNEQIINSQGELTVNSREVYSDPHTFNMQMVQELYLQNVGLIIKHNICHIFEGVITLPISSEGQPDLIYEMWYREYSTTSCHYIIVARSEYSIDIQEHGVYNPLLEIVTMLYRNHFTE
jgi:hypothetical protein